jgi:hypothetical protein
VAQDIVKATLGDRAMDAWIVGKLLDRAVGEDKRLRKKLRDELERFAADLAGPCPTTLERVLTDTAALSWFVVRMDEAQYLSAINSDQGMALSHSEHSQRRIERAHRRLLATLKTLATVRRLAGPAIQFNVAQQVNVGEIGRTGELSRP